MSEKRKTPLSLPPTLTMAKNLATAIVKHVGDGLRKVTIDQYKDRIGICNSNECGYRLKNRCTHTSCGCFIDLKAWWASEKCPDDPPHWPELTDTDKT